MTDDSRIVGVLGRYSDGNTVRTVLLTDRRYHDPALASQIEYGTALAVIPRDATLGWGEEIFFQPQGGGSSVTVADIPAINRAGRFNAWAGYTIAGLDWTLKQGYANMPWADWELVFDAQGCGKVEFDGSRKIIIPLADKFSWLRQPYATQIFDDTTPNDRLINTLAPKVAGEVFQVASPMYDPSLLLFYAASNAGSIALVSEGGNPHNVFWQRSGNFFQLGKSAQRKITANIAGPPLEDLGDVDLLEGFGNFENWTGGEPDGFDVYSNDATATEIDLGTEGTALGLSVTGTGSADTGWVSPTAIGSSANGPGWSDDAGSFDDADRIAAVQADDGTYIEASPGGTPIRTSHCIYSDWQWSIPADVAITGIEVRVVAEETGTTATWGGANRPFHLVDPDGYSIGQKGITAIPDTKTTQSFGGDGDIWGNSDDITRDIVADPAFGVGFSASRDSGVSTTVRVHQIEARAFYTGDSLGTYRLYRDLQLETGKRYQIRVVAVQAGESIMLNFGSAAESGGDILESDDPFASAKAIIEDETIYEGSFTALGPFFAMRFSYDGTSGKQHIKSVEVVDGGAVIKKYHPLGRYIAEDAGRDPDQVIENDALALLQTQAENPDLGWYVRDQTTREQLFNIFSQSLGGAGWGSMTGKLTAGQMRIPQQPDGEYLVLDESRAASESHAIPDPGDGVTDRVWAAKNQDPIPADNAAGVTSTWTEADREKVVADWRITERADFSNLEGFATLTISGVDPATGSTDGGTAITGTGTGFSDFNAAGGDTITVGGNALQNITIVSDTEFTGDTPASTGGATGTVDVVVTIGGQSVTLEGGFAYKAPWTPADMTTEWWPDASDADALTLDGSGNVEQLDEKSGNLRHISQPTAGDRPPAIGATGETYIAFDGVSHHLLHEAAFIYDLGDCTVVSVINVKSTADLYWLAEGRSTNTTPLYGPGRTNGWPYIRNDSSGLLIGSTDNSDASYESSTWRLWGYEDIQTQFRNFIDANHVDTINYSRSGSMTLDRLCLGALARTSIEFHVEMDFGESVCFAGTNETLRQKIEGYLAHKWDKIIGITYLVDALAADHPYKDNPPLKD